MQKGKAKSSTGKQQQILKSDKYSVLRHKLNGPLTTMRLYSEALLSGSVGDLTPGQRHYVQEVHDASKKLILEVKRLKK